jgi:hypothetical protein
LQPGLRVIDRTGEMLAPGGVMVGHRPLSTLAHRPAAPRSTVMSIAASVIVRDQVVLFPPGAMPEAALEDLLELTQRIDTDDVRAKIAKEKRAA